MGCCVGNVVSRYFPKYQRNKGGFSCLRWWYSGPVKLEEAKYENVKPWINKVWALITSLFNLESQNAWDSLRVQCGGCGCGFRLANWRRAVLIGGSCTTWSYRIKAAKVVLCASNWPCDEGALSQMLTFSMKFIGNERQLSNENNVAKLLLCFDCNDGAPGGFSCHSDAMKIVEMDRQPDYCFICTCYFSGDEPFSYREIGYVPGHIRSRLAHVRNHLLCDHWNFWGALIVSSWNIGLFNFNFIWLIVLSIQPLTLRDFAFPANIPRVSMALLLLNGIFTWSRCAGSTSRIIRSPRRPCWPLWQQWSRTQMCLCVSIWPKLWVFFSKSARRKRLIISGCVSKYRNVEGARSKFVAREIITITQIRCFALL